MFTGSLGICIDDTLDDRWELLLDVSSVLLEFLKYTVGKQATEYCISKPDLVLGFEHVEHRESGDHLAFKREGDLLAVDALLYEGWLQLDEPI